MNSLYPIRLLKDHSYAIVDCVAANDAPQDWPLISLAPLGFENEKHLLPALLPFSEMSDTQQINLLESIEQCHLQHESLPVVSFLDSTANPEKLRAHFISRLLIRLPQGGRALLRSYDPLS